MTELLAGAAFRGLFASYQHTAFRLETRERYVEDEEQEPLRKFLAGEPADETWFADWVEDIQAATAEGKRVERVRVVNERHSDYTRFGLDLARLNVGAGEDIRYLPRDHAAQLHLPDEDFWLFDSSTVAVLRFADDDRLLGVEVVDDPMEVLQRCQWRDVAWHYAGSVARLPRQELPRHLMSSFQRERDALGQRLREIRIAARLTGRALAAQAGWHSSKISKIEAGKQTPSEHDIELWAQHCGAAGRLPDLVAALRSLESHYQEHRRQFQAGMAGHQRDYAGMEASTEFVRNFESSCISGLVQTPDYARFRLAEAVTYNGAPDDLDEAVAARMERQHVLYAPGKRFHIVMTEGALRYRLCPPDVMEGQLDRLVSASTMRNVRLGIIPFDVTYPVMPVHGLHRKLPQPASAPKPSRPGPGRPPGRANQHRARRYDVGKHAKTDTTG